MSHYLLHYFFSHYCLLSGLLEEVLTGFLDSTLAPLQSTFNPAAGKMLFSLDWTIYSLTQHAANEKAKPLQWVHVTWSSFTSMIQPLTANPLLTSLQPHWPLWCCSNILLPVWTFVLVVPYKHHSPSYHISHSHILTSLLKCRFLGEVFSDHLIKTKLFPTHPILFILYYVSIFT